MPNVSKEPIAHNQPAFNEVLGQIRLTRQAVFAQVNTAFIDFVGPLANTLARKCSHRLGARVLSQI